MKTLFDKIWDAHVVTTVQDGPTQLYIDRHLCHEVTSPQAFAGLRSRGLEVYRPERTTLTADHTTASTEPDARQRRRSARRSLARAHAAAHARPA